MRHHDGRGLSECQEKWPDWRSGRRSGRLGTPGALRTAPVASGEPGRMLSSTPFLNSLGECRLMKPSVSRRRIWRRPRTTIVAAPRISRGTTTKRRIAQLKRGIIDLTSLKEDTLEAENSALRELLEQAGLDASRLLVQAGINATEKEAAERLQRLLLEELHHRVKNTLATVMAIASQSLRNATDLEQGREAISHRLIALGRAHDLLLQTNWISASLPAIVRAAIEPFDTPGAERFVVQGSRSMLARPRFCPSQWRSMNYPRMR
jgi:hypothetical protein